MMVVSGSRSALGERRSGEGHEVLDEGQYRWRDVSIVA